jgi:hypothetical protein
LGAATSTSLTVSTGNAYLYLNRTTSSSGQVGLQFQSAGTTTWYNYLDTSATTLAWYQTTTNSNVLTLTTAGVLTATSFVGSGSSLTGIPTSIVAGTGISVSGATGAVTVTATGGGSVGIRSTIYATAGSFTFTVPTGTTAVKVTCVGGGGGGGGGRDNTAGGGGGGGGYAIKWVSGLTPGGTVAVTVGASGSGVSSFSSQAGSGGTTSFGAYCTATGGYGGYGGPAGTNHGGGGPGSGTTGDIKSPSTAPNSSGGGGYSCCGSPVGGAGATSVFYVSGLAGVPNAGSATGNGNGGAGGTSGGNGSPGWCCIEY